MLKTIINIGLRATGLRTVGGRALAGLVFVAGGVVLGMPAARADGDSLHRLAALVDYVAADYPGAVKAGVVIAPGEYEEQKGLLRDAEGIAGQLPASAATEASRSALKVALGRVTEAVSRRASPQEVAAACKTVRARLLDDFGLVLVPPAPPSAIRGKALYAANCAKCHGDDGRAVTEQARLLKPPPVSFFDAERMSRISPALAFHALTFGVKDTGMASFDTLSAVDRWSLAFYVVGLRHEGDAAAGGRAFATAKVPLSTSPSRLALLSDAELDALLSSAMPSVNERAQALAWLRTKAPFEVRDERTFQAARTLLSGVQEAARTGNVERAKELALSAYLDGVEPHEAALRARDPRLAARIEEAFLSLRRSIEVQGDGGALVAQRVAAATVLLDGAEERPMNGGVAFVAAMTIALREGLEAALLIAALLAFLRKTGRGDRARVVHAGWLAAVPAGLLVWFVAGVFVGGAHRELVEAVMTLAAAGMIIAVSHWVFGRKEAQHWVGFLRRKVTDLAPGERAWPLFALAFVAAFREAVEIVLFYRALLLDAVNQRAEVALGATLGAVAIFGVVLVLGRLGRRLDPRPVMLASSVLLAALSIALVGRGIRALQEGGYLTLTPLPVPDGSVVGLYPTLQGLLAQGVVLLVILAPLLRDRLRAPTAPVAQP